MSLLLSESHEFVRLRKCCKMRVGPFRSMALLKIKLMEK